MYLGNAHRAAGDRRARSARQRALTILDELDHPVTDDVRAKLQAIS
jgi:hypothetical protein